MSLESEIAVLRDAIPKHRAHAQHWRRQAKQYPERRETYLHAATTNYNHAMTYLDWLRDRIYRLEERNNARAAA